MSNHTNTPPSNNNTATIFPNNPPQQQENVNNTMLSQDTQKDIQTNKRENFPIEYNSNYPSGTGAVANDYNYNPYGDYTFPFFTSLFGSSLIPAGHTFLGWARDNPYASSPDYVEGQTVQQYMAGEFLDATFFAVWQATSSPKYKVTYDGNSNTGGSVPTDNNTYAQGTSVTVQANTGNLVKSGHKFVGWATASNTSTPAFAVAGSSVNPPSFGMPASNVTLYAVWQPIYSVTYNGNGSTGGSIPTDSSSPYASGATVTVLGNTNNLTKTGYTFEGWNSNQTQATNGTIQYTQGQTFTINQNTTLYAVWKLIPATTYKVTYNGNGHTKGTAPTDSNSYGSGKSVTVLGQGTLEKTNYAFLGWNSNQTQANNGTVQYTAGQTFTMGSQAVTLYAVWIILRTVTYNGNDHTTGTAPNDSNSPYKNGSTVTVLGQGSLVKTGYVFQGWATSKSGSVAYTQGQTFTITTNTTLYAVWQQNTTPTYTVSYNGNSNTSGTAPTDPLNPYREGDVVGVIANTGNLLRSGYAFLGWSSNKNASTPQYTVNSLAVSPNSFSMPTDNVVLYAVWQSTSNSGHRVTYNANRPSGVSGTGNVPTDNTNYAQNASVSVKANPSSLTAEGHDFLGWAYLNNVSGPNFTVSGSSISPSTFSITSNVTLYAIWQPIGGGSCDWSNVPFINLKGNLFLDAVATMPSDPKQAIEISSDPYDFTSWNKIIEFMRTPNSTDWNYDEPKSAAIKFKSNVPGGFGQALTVSLFQVNFDWTSANAGIVCSRHFVVRKDLFLNGMLNSIEGAIVLHAGVFRTWGGTQPNQSTQPTIFIGDTASQPSNVSTHTIEFRRFDPSTNNDFVPIQCKGLRDSNGNLGAHGQVLTNTNSGLLWQNAVNVTSRIEKGQVQTNNNGDDIIVNFSPTFTNQPIITTGCLDASARSISVTITSLAGQPMNDLRAGFRIRASISSNASHTHKQMSVGTRTTLPPPNTVNRIRSASIGDIEAVIYSINDGGNGNTHDIHTDSTTVNQVITRVPNLTLHYIAIGT